MKIAGDDKGDHPRVCGEHDLIALVVAHCLGSSPRVRGTQRVAVHPLLRLRIIPACAGNTADSAGEPQAPRDHPRVCGEHRRIPASARMRWGSSPRVRGTPIRSCAPSIPTGIIPACAGNTRIPESEFGRVGDHPRVCGEHHPRSRRCIRLRGSSPRVRGTP